MTELLDIERHRRSTKSDTSIEAICPGAVLLHDAFDKHLCKDWLAEAARDPGDRQHGLSACRKRFLWSDDMAQTCLRMLREAGLQDLRQVLSNLRYITYGAGDYIMPHVDGVRVDPHTGESSKFTLIVFLRDTPEGGATTFLTDVDSGEEVASVQPKQGSALVFRHNIAHRGDVCGTHGKVLLRGDMY